MLSPEYNFYPSRFNITHNFSQKSFSAENIVSARLSSNSRKASQTYHLNKFDSRRHMAADTLGLDDDRIVLRWVLVRQSLRIEI
jgi:hypothetical protein